MSRPKPVLLCILDGWGAADPADDNAITKAHTPTMDRLRATYPYALLKTSGLDVGLPDSQMGNSEVGHMNIGSGRVVMQDLPRIDEAIRKNELGQNPHFTQLVSRLKESGGRCHLLGLLSDGGVHAHQNHILALAKLLNAEGLTVYIHAFLDGRDTAPNSAKNYVNWLEQEIKLFPQIKIATLSGRYYAMDRDNRWSRVEKAYQAMCAGVGQYAHSAIEAIDTSYQQEIYDEFILPTVIDPVGGIRDGDAVMMANFRSDRAREILQALLDPAFDGFKRTICPKLVGALGMVEYSTQLNQWMDILFQPAELTDILGEVVARHGLKQLKVAETEKYAHVTFFFNGGREEPFVNEERILIPSPNVATYDLKPEMSAFEVTAALLTAIKEDKFDLIVVNYANTDMVGHTGDLDAAIKAVEVVDHCVGQLATIIEEKNGVLLITADHGNAEQMTDHETHERHTSHTTGPVPIIIVNPGLAGKKIRDGKLADIAPTILHLMEIEKPAVMTGDSLLSTALSSKC